MIRSLNVVNLNGRMTFDLRFNEDINIITGKNGSGKTTILKLLWYAISGNIQRIVPEITFDSFTLVTDKMSLQFIHDASKPRRRMVRLRYQQEGGEPKEVDRPVERVMDWDELNEVNRLMARSGTSTFFPTFRRIEGGFSISAHPQGKYVMRMGRRYTPEYYYSSEAGNLQEAVNLLSERLSDVNHRFVASISTDDIVRLLTSKYAEISERTNRLHMELSRFILARVQEDLGHDKSAGLANRNGEEAESREALEEIQQRARNVTSQSETLLRPFTVLSELIAKVFQYRGIKLSEPVTLGDAANAIASEVLSAGEKQMLSFLCYNSFASRSCLFIDEPEISLHVDWQRILFPVLLQQTTGNQFIVATHSPFIYSKYADKELLLSSDRGNADADTPDDGG
jgi:predicted ATPase